LSRCAIAAHKLHARNDRKVFHLLFERLASEITLVEAICMIFTISFEVKTLTLEVKNYTELAERN
jgi:hypothetical protein